MHALTLLLEHCGAEQRGTHDGSANPGPMHKEICALVVYCCNKWHGINGMCVPIPTFSVEELLLSHFIDEEIEAQIV